MDEYITKEAAIQAFEWSEADVIEDYGDGCNFGFSRDSIKGAINAIPAVDVAPVVHGRWVKKWDLYDKGFYISRKVWYECSNCGIKTNHKDESFEIEVGYNYCPNCGAKMDGGVENG